MNSNNLTNITPKKVNDSLNILRLFSLFCIIGVHFFLNSGFYSELIVGPKMLILCILRALFIICVPMFITLTGYLMNKKEPSITYYLKLNKTLIIYLLCSIIYSFFAKYYLHEEMNLIIFLYKLFSYNGTPYSWYIELYIGLYLLIPFLNIIFNNLKTEKELKILLVTLIFLTGLPAIINIFNFSSLSWWKNPNLSNTYIQILPSWWSFIYPLFYYFLGAYLSKYHLNLNRAFNFILLMLAIILTGLFDFYRSYNSTYVLGSWNDYSSLFEMLITLLTFNLFINISLKKISAFKSNFLKLLSNASLGAYLISRLFDILYYNILNKNIIQFNDKLKFAPFIIIASFISSLFLSIIINFIYISLFLIFSGIKNISIHK